MSDPSAVIDSPPMPGVRPSVRERVVCHLIASNFAGGPEKQILELSSRLPALGWRSIVGSFAENRPAVEVVDAARSRGLEAFLITTRSRFSPRAVGQLAHTLRHRRVDVLVTHGYKANLIGHLAARRTGTPHVATVRGYTAEDWKVRAYEAVDRRLLSRLERIFCVSEATRAWVTALGVRDERVEVIPNAVEVVDVDPLDLRTELGLAGDAVVLVAAGRLSTEKGHRHLVEAMRMLGPRLPAAHLVILGEGPERRSLEEQIGRGGLIGRVVLAGFRIDVPRCLAGADLVVNPSLAEGLPNVILEALAVRAPVVATNVGGVDELIEHGKTGLLVPRGDARALATAISDALADRESARRWGSNGRRRVSAGYTFERQAKRFSTACTRLIDHNAREESTS